MIREIEDIFLGMGFELADGPWVEDDWHNFEALNIPPDHPARDLQDTFWLKDGNCLRTHTSPVQVRLMARGELPIRAVAIGRAFRNEATDATHEHTFHQMEGLLIDREVTVGHMLYVLRTFLGEVFGDDVEVRLRPSYFPFVEPGFEMDMRLRGAWMELLGCGLVHPNVLEAGGIDPYRYSGFAFGLGIDRLVMLRYGIEDIRHFMRGTCASCASSGREWSDEALLPLARRAGRPPGPCGRGDRPPADLPHGRDRGGGAGGGRTRWCRDRPGGPGPPAPGRRPAEAVHGGPRGRHVAGGRLRRAQRRRGPDRLLRPGRPDASERA